MCPKCRNTRLQGRELFPQEPRRTPLAEPNELGDALLRRDFAQDVNVFGHDLKFQDFAIKFGGDFLDDALEPFGYLACQYLPAVLRAKDYMIFTGVNAVDV